MSWRKWPPNTGKAPRSPCAACGGTEWSKGFEKKHEIGEDLAKTWSDEVQKLTDQYVKKVDETLSEKEKDIRQV
jgi:hypothetical protein